jgi:Cys-rich repeat protein
VQPGTGTTCTSNTQCGSGEYCDFPDQLCRVGCRDNLDCPSGQNCDGTHTCTGGGGGGSGQFGATCGTDGDCSSPMICGVLTFTCAEQCTSAADCVACNATNGSCRCNGFGFCTP